MDLFIASYLLKSTSEKKECACTSIGISACNSRGKLGTFSSLIVRNWKRNSEFLMHDDIDNAFNLANLQCFIESFSRPLWRKKKTFKQSITIHRLFCSNSELSSLLQHRQEVIKICFKPQIMLVCFTNSEQSFVLTTTCITIPYRNDVFCTYKLAFILFVCC